MKRRKFLLGVGSATAAGSALIGSGAFSRVEAQRSVTVQVAEDPNAYLGLDKCQVDGGETPNSSYAHLDGDGHLKIYMDEDNPTIGESPLGEGVNSDSTSWFDNVFQICNQGKEDVCVHIEDNDDWPTVPDGEPHAGDRRVQFYRGDNRSTTLIGEENAVALPLGECICVGIRTKTYGLQDGDELLEALDDEEIRIVADVDGECVTTEECPLFEVDYECTTYGKDDKARVWNAQGSSFKIQNVGPIKATYKGYAVVNSPDTDFGTDVTLDSGESNTVDIAPPDPHAGVVFWEGPDACPAPTWGDRKDGAYSPLVTYAENNTDISDDDFVAFFDPPTDVAETREDKNKGDLDEIPDSDFPESLDDYDVKRCGAEE